MDSPDRFIREEKSKILEFGERFCSEMPSPEDKIKYFFSNARKLKEMQNWLYEKKRGQKSQLIANEHRTKGVALYIKSGDSGRIKRLNQSLVHFNTSLSYSSFDSEISKTEASKVFANRSAVFYDLYRYREALMDIQTALDLNYPFKHKVWLRRAKIFHKMGFYNEALSALDFMEESNMVEKLEELQLTRKAVTDSVQNDHREKFHRTQKEEMELIKKNPLLKTWEALRNNENVSLTKPIEINQKDENPEFQFASRKMRINYDPRRTRHIIATESIQPGDVLFNEVPFASMLLSESYQDYCYHCHIWLNGHMFPCKRCTDARYCSEFCYNESWKEYHNIECQPESSMLLETGLCHLAVRVVIIAGAQNVLETINKSKNALKPEDSIPVFRTASLEHGDTKAIQYRRIYSLVEHSNKMVPADVYTYAKTAAGVTHWLQTFTKFFEGRTVDEMYEIGGAIFRHLCQLISNAQRVYSCKRDDEGGEIDYERLIIGSGIYTSTSLMNHSCDPNISTNYAYGPYDGRRLIVKATRAIGVGEEIVNSYGVTYARHDLLTRQSLMSEQYFFECKCQRCFEDSTNGKSFVEKFESIICNTCKALVYCPSEDFNCDIICQNCGKFDHATKRKIRTAVAMAKTLREAERWEVKEDELLRSHQIISKYFPESHRLVAESHNALAKYYTMANPRVAIYHSQKSLEYVKTRFGSCSNEFGLELRNHAELLEILDMKDDRCQKTTEDLLIAARAILENYNANTYDEEYEVKSSILPE